MRISLILIACSTALCVMTGCSDEDCDPCSPCAPAVSEQPLAQCDIGIGGGTAAPVSDTLRICFVSSSSDTLLDLLVTAADDETVREIDSRIYPPFTDAIARLSDGIDDQWMFWVRFVPSNGGVGSGTMESSWLDGGFTGDYVPDLHGVKITKIWLYLNNVSVVQEGGYTNFDLDVRIVFMGTP